MFMFSRKRTFAHAGDVSKQNTIHENRWQTVTHLWIKKRKANCFLSNSSESGKRDSNSRPQPWQGCALPTELFPQTLCNFHRRGVISQTQCKGKAFLRTDKFSPRFFHFLRRKKRICACSAAQSSEGSVFRTKSSATASVCTLPTSSK